MCSSAVRVAAQIAILVAATGCEGSKHARVASFTRPPVPAGFVEQTGDGWRIAVPSTWNNEHKGISAELWMSADPQPVDDYHANVIVNREPFAGPSYDYAKNTEHELRRDGRASVESARDDVIDGDPTSIIEARWGPLAPAAPPYRTMQAGLSSRGTGWVVTCSVAATAFERYRSTCDAVLRSFAIER